MTPKLAIHHSERTYSDRWIEYCDRDGIAYEIVDAFDSSIIERLASVDALLWHWRHDLPGDVLIAEHVIRAAEAMGLKVFPNSATCWHFDDKIAQKYLLEALGAPLVPTDVFYDLKTALRWIEGAAFPRVFKLRKGAGSANVRLVKTAAEARSLARRAFSGGFKPITPYFSDARVRVKNVRRRKDWLGVVKRAPSSLRRIRQASRLIGREAGYVYFQEFVPDNTFDTRITVVGDRAFGFTRMVREGDFRASGSGQFDYDTERIDRRCVTIAFDVARRMKSQSMAFDFVQHAGQSPLITEISFGYNAPAIHGCPGHWDSSMAWHEGKMWPQDAILSDLLESLE